MGGSDGWTSQQTDAFDAITLMSSQNFSLNTTIYIGVYAASFTAYTLNFFPDYAVSYNEILTTASPLSDGTFVPVTFLQEYEEDFFSFSPWWADFENRTIVLAADVIFNTIFFYAAANNYPEFYLTNLQDTNDVIAIPPGSYQISDSYFIRVRPDFALYDLISNRQYIFDFIAFS